MERSRRPANAARGARPAGRPLPWNKDDQSVAAKLAARYAAAASLAQRHNDMEAIFTSSPLSYRFAEWVQDGTPQTPEVRKSPRVKPLGREHPGMPEKRAATPSEAAKEVFAARLRERTPANRLQLRSSRTARPEPLIRRRQPPSPSPPQIQKVECSTSTSRQAQAISSPRQRLPGTETLTGSQSLCRWPPDLPSSASPLVDEDTAGSAAASSPESNSAAVAAAISAAATAVWQAAEAEAEAAAAQAMATPKPTKSEARGSSESPPWPQASPGLQRSQSSAASTPTASAAPAAVTHARSPSTPRLVEVRPASVNVPIVVPTVPRSFYPGPLMPIACPGAVAVPLSRSPSPGALFETGTPRSRYVHSPSVIVRRSTSPMSTPGSLTLLPREPGAPEKTSTSMAAAAWAAAGRQAMSRSASATPATPFSAAAGYGFPLAPRIMEAASRQRGLDMSDPLDQALLEALRRLDTLTTARLEVQRLGAGRYEIEGRRVQVRTSGASPRRKDKELRVYEEEENGVLREGVDLSYYLSQAANVAAGLRVSAVGRIPQELRLTFGNNDSNGQGVENASPGHRQRCMRQAVAEAAQRSKAAEVVERQLTAAFGARKDVKNFTKATVLSL